MIYDEPDENENEKYFVGWGCAFKNSRPYFWRFHGHGMAA
jgi:hypothetical protein